VKKDAVSIAVSSASMSRIEHADRDGLLGGKVGKSVIPPVTRHRLYRFQATTAKRARSTRGVIETGTFGPMPSTAPDVPRHLHLIG
jgi:hypothetical protein